jgi:ribosomal protein S18 acetylase RimI-like enzyme
VPLLVRAAGPDDAGDLTRVHTASWQWAYAGIVPAAYLDDLDATLATRTRSRRAALADPRPGTATLVAVDDDVGSGVVLGFVSVGPYRVGQDPDHIIAGEGEVRAIYVAPERAGAGVGSALLRAGLDRLEAAGLTPVRLWVLADNVRARAFYARFGFVADGEAGSFRVDVDRGHVELPEVRLTRG